MMVETERSKWMTSIERALEELKRKPDFIVQNADAKTRSLNEARRKAERH